MQKSGELSLRERPATKTVYLTTFDGLIFAFKEEWYLEDSVPLVAGFCCRLFICHVFGTWLNTWTSVGYAVHILDLRIGEVPFVWARYCMS
jgi:hypothetical protein